MNTLVILKHSLLGLLLEALRLLALTNNQREMIVSSFHISFETHLRAPERKSGEPYFFHIFRQVLRVIQLMVQHKVVSAELICIILLHDAIEDAEKGKTTPFLVTSNIQLLVGDLITRCVLSLTKNKDVHTRESYLLGIIANDNWLVLVAKPFDGEDNIKTLKSTNIATQAMKVKEVLTHYPAMRKRAIELLRKAGESGELSDVEQWVTLVRHIHRDVRHHALRQRHRLEAMNIKVV